MEVLNKARELAEEILKTPEYVRMTSAEESVENDEAGSALMQDMNLLQQEYIKSAREGTPAEELKLIENMLQDKHSELMDYELTGEMVKTKAAFDRLIKLINKEITSGITGGCSTDDCSGCSGCN